MFQSSSSSTVDSTLWTSLLARLKASDMTEQDLRECSPTIQRQIFVEILGFDSQSTSTLMNMMRENRISSHHNNNNSPNNNKNQGNQNNNNTFPSFIRRQPGSVEWNEVEESLHLSSSIQHSNNDSSENNDNSMSKNLFEVRQVSAVPSSAVPTSREKDFRTARIESGCQPERLFRFCSRKHLESVSISCNIFDSFVPNFDCALNKHGQVIGRTLVCGFSRRDLSKFGEMNRCILGVDALVTKPVAMTMGQFRQWCSSLNDCQEAHESLAEHGATCVQIIPEHNNNNNNKNMNEFAEEGEDAEDEDFYDDESLSFPKLIIFDSTISLLKVVAFTNIVHDSNSFCTPAGTAARGCPKHNHRKFEFWNKSTSKLMCSLCLYAHNNNNKNNNHPKNNNGGDEILVVEEAAPIHFLEAQNFRSNLKTRQQRIATTLSHLEVMQDTFSDRADQLRETVADCFAEIRRLVDLQEADVFAALDLAVRGNFEDLSTSSEIFQRYEADTESFLKDAEDTIYQFQQQHHHSKNYNYNGESTKILGLVALAQSSKNGDELDLGREEEHEKNHDLPTFHFDREEITRSLSNACKLFSVATSSGPATKVDIVEAMTSKIRNATNSTTVEEAEKQNKFDDF